MTAKSPVGLRTHAQGAQQSFERQRDVEALRERARAPGEQPRGDQRLQRARSGAVREDRRAPERDGAVDQRRHRPGRGRGDAPEA